MLSGLAHERHREAGRRRVRLWGAAHTQGDARGRWVGGASWVARPLHGPGGGARARPDRAPALGPSTARALQRPDGRHSGAPRRGCPRRRRHGRGRIPGAARLESRAGRIGERDCARSRALERCRAVCVSGHGGSRPSRRDATTAGRCRRARLNARGTRAGAHPRGVAAARLRGGREDHSAGSALR